MSNSALLSIFKTVDSIKSAIELGNSTNLAADIAKLAAQLSTAAAVSTAVITYSSLQGLGRSLALWRLGQRVSGNEVNIAQSAALAGFVAAEFVGWGIDVVRDWELGGKLYDWTHPDPTTNTSFTDAINWQPPRDPLVLDLDGDGIEAVGINPNSPVLFDHDADGIKTATGWIGSDDGILVLDRNGNGLIDSGRELFGDNTLLQNGARAGQTAANGFEAIADLDANGDGHINSSDAVYSQLRVWRDANQDGISQAGELQTVTQTGIASIQVTGQATTIDLGQGNTQPFTGSFTRADGSTGTSAVAEVTGSLLLASNNFYREFTTPVALTTHAQALPEMQGSGWVRDLREVANGEKFRWIA